MAENKSIGPAGLRVQQLRQIAKLEELNGELLAACEAIAEMKRYIFIDTPLIEVVEKLQQQIADMKTTAAAAIAKAKEPQE